jgi:hypothetical protein
VRASVTATRGPPVRVEFPNPQSPAPTDPHRQCDSDQTMTQASDQGYLMPPSPILSLLVDDYGTYRHLTSTAPSPFRCSTVLLLHG